MNSSYTEKEIDEQPRLCRETYLIIESKSVELENFLNKIFIFDDLQIILTGAGSSAYIGEVLQNTFQRNVRRETKAIASTDLISHSKDFFDEKRTTLMISFARSGDSPESQAAVNLAERQCNNLFHLIITCNPEGKLAKNVNTKNSYIILMPSKANDKGLAMTGSFTSMLLAGILVSNLSELDKSKLYVDKLFDYGNKILKNYKPKIKKVAALDFNRIVFLGSGVLKGIARESQLKVMELTDGRVIGKYDSYLGLRHGPKAVINYSTVIVYLFSSDEFVNKYEYDLVRSINGQKEKLYEIGIGESLKCLGEIQLDLSIQVSKIDNVPEEFFAVCAVLPSQLLGLYKSINLGLSPDSPSTNKSINRVVQGVIIYE